MIADFRITQYMDGTFVIEGTHFHWMYNKKLPDFDGITADELMPAMAEITEIVAGEGFKAKFFVR